MTEKEFSSPSPISQDPPRKDLDPPQLFPQDDLPLRKKAEQGLALFSILFEEAVPGNAPKRRMLSFPRTGETCFLLLLRDALELILRTFSGKGESPEEDAGNHLLPCVFNTLAEICLEEESFRRALDEALMSTLISRMEHTHGEREDSAERQDLLFYLFHAKKLAYILSDLIPVFCLDLPPEIRDLIRPSARGLQSRESVFLKWTEKALLLELKKRHSRQGEFGSGRVYRYRNGKFQELELKGIRAVNEFYGYHAARETFLEHFRDFSEGKGNLPLLISSLPGLGKTQMTISHSLFFRNIVLILPEAGDIAEGLEELIRKLAAHPDRKFMVFFDDIDNLHTNWYYFRANIGGTFQLPPNISITISSNQEFPANISSRGRGFVFPIFDEIRCQEMVEDFLLSKGMRNPPPELVSVIASDYVEEFGQKKFEELSPRTLVRYLNVYRNDERKRKRMLELSRGEIITRPDAQVFYEENVKLLRSIYGEKVSEEMKRRLSGGEGGGANTNGSGNEK